MPAPKLSNEKSPAFLMRGFLDFKIYRLFINE